MYLLHASGTGQKPTPKAMDFSIHKYPSLDSTNDAAMRLLAAGRGREGVVIQAEEQLRGRGAGNNVWVSEPGKNLTFSVILMPSFLAASRQFALTQMVSLALCDVLSASLDARKLAVKWPNDILYDGKKLAGILIQNRIRGNRMDYAVVGVGLNVNQRTFAGAGPNPVSVASVTGKEEDRTALLQAILTRLGFYYEKLKQDDFALEPSYLQKLFRAQQWAGYRDANGHFVAKITGVNTYGQLLMQDKQGKIRTYGFKEVVFLP